MEANEIKEAMAFFAIIFNRGDGFWARRWKFFELINNRGDTIIRSHRVGLVTFWWLEYCWLFLTSGKHRAFKHLLIQQ